MSERRRIGYCLTLKKAMSLLPNGAGVIVSNTIHVYALRAM
jgi:hypothetical protein